jgi:hypothetical protein
VSTWVVSEKVNHLGATGGALRVIFPYFSEFDFLKNAHSTEVPPSSIQPGDYIMILCYILGSDPFVLDLSLNWLLSIKHCNFYLSKNCERREGSSSWKEVGV